MNACLLNVGSASASSLHVKRQQFRDDVFAGGVDDVQEHDERSDQLQVTIAEHEAEAAARRAAVPARSPRAVSRELMRR